MSNECNGFYPLSETYKDILQATSIKDMNEILNAVNHNVYYPIIMLNNLSLLKRKNINIVGNGKFPENVLLLHILNDSSLILLI